MRASLPVILLLASLLGACATRSEAPASKHIAQSGTLKVAPALVNSGAAPASAASNAQATPTR